MKPTPRSIEAAKAVHVYLVKEGIYLDERQAEQVALAVESKMAPLYEANARLIAAAPEMLAGIERAIEYLEGSDPRAVSGGHNCDVLRSVLRAVRAKAFGQNAELCQPCPPSTPPHQETADGQGLA